MGPARPGLGQHRLAGDEDPANNVYVSAASVWEIVIKRRLGKVRFDGSAVAAIAANGFLALPILPIDAEAAGALDWQHSDPFDRLLVAQSIQHGLVLVTRDRAVRAFAEAAQLWAG